MRPNEHFVLGFLSELGFEKEAATLKQKLMAGVAGLGVLAGGAATLARKAPTTRTTPTLRQMVYEGKEMPTRSLKEMVYGGGSSPSVESIAERIKKIRER